MGLTCRTDPSKYEDVWAYRQCQRLRLNIEGDRGRREHSVKEVVDNPFNQLVPPDIDSVVDKTSIAQCSIERRRGFPNEGRRFDGRGDRNCSMKSSELVKDIQAIASIPHC